MLEKVVAPISLSTKSDWIKEQLIRITDRLIAEIHIRFNFHIFETIQDEFIM